MPNMSWVKYVLGLPLLEDGHPLPPCGILGDRPAEQISFPSAFIAEKFYHCLVKAQIAFDL